MLSAIISVATLDEQWKKKAAINQSLECSKGSNTRQNKLGRAYAATSYPIQKPK